MASVEHQLRLIEQRLEARPPWTVAEEPGPGGGSGGEVGRAAVALVVRPGPTELDLLLIKRADRAGDPWSGHMALPGGRRGLEDVTLLDTALRETHEEVGIDLGRHGHYLGRLDDVQPRAGGPRIAVSSFVFSVPAGTTTRINAEVERTLWIPLRTLTAPGATTEYLHELASGAVLRFPAIGYREHVIWGLTHRIISQFLTIARIGAEQGGVQ